MADSTTLSTTREMLTLTTQIVVAHVAANKVAAVDMPALINAVYGAVLHAAAPRALPQEPAVPIKKSIQGDYLVCLEDGAKLKVLARYLKRFGLTPETYRAKWRLPRDYPMIAPALAIQRSALAKQLKLGKASVTIEKEFPEAKMPTAPVSATVPVELEGKHTGTNVFANFPDGDERPFVARTATDRAGRPRGVHQTGQTGRKRSATVAM